MPKQMLKIIPLGGLGEIGKNMMAFECGDDIIVVDCGLMFPEEEMLGIDLVIPDITYLKEHKENVRAIVITHGHEDHIGALPYILPDLNVPVYATRLTRGLISVKLKEHKLLASAELNVIQPGDELFLGVFHLEFFQVNHSIPDAVGIAIHTPVGTVVHTGDFKFDHTPVDGRLTDFAKLSELGDNGVLVLLSDSTYVERTGYTLSERVLNQAFDEVLLKARGRVIVATFASLISRIQQVVDAADRHGRKVSVVGRSMVNNVRMAVELGYLSVPDHLMISIDEAGRLSHDRVVILTTGTQGEPTSGLARMANRDNKQVGIVPGDTVVVSATPIPGNEHLINRTIDNLFKEGATVLYSTVAGVHVSGHGSQEELKLMLRLIRPRFFVPIHGEYRHLATHARLAESLGIASEDIFVIENGHVLELTEDTCRLAGRVPSGYVYVDGLTVGDVGHVVLRDRRLMSQDGIVVVIIAVDQQTGAVVGRPDVVSRGFVYLRESEELIESAREVVAGALNHHGEHLVEWGFINNKVKDTLSKFLYDQTRRRPMVLPVVMEV